MKDFNKVTVGSMGAGPGDLAVRRGKDRSSIDSLEINVAMESQ